MISVCVATYNGEKYIRAQLLSILKQLSVNDEIIISDDGSIDKTCEVIETLNDGRLKVYLNKGAKGFTHNFENALRYAKGDYIFLSDQDDIWLDNKVETTIRAFEKGSDFVISDCITVDEELNIIQKSRFSAFNIKPGFFRHLIKSRYLGCCVAFKKEILDIALPFPKNDYLIEHDVWLVAIGFLYFKVDLIRDPLILYRRHNSNASKGGFEKGYPIKIKILKRIYRLYCLTKIRSKVNKRWTG